jgi:hypothetical protein
MRTRKSSFIAAVLILAVHSAAHADDLGGCDAALIKETYNSFSSDQTDWRLATLVSEKDYNEIKQDAGGTAKIFGVPVGASYSEYQKNVHDKLQTYNESLTRNQLRNILWTRLVHRPLDACQISGSKWAS